MCICASMFTCVFAYMRILTGFYVYVCITLNADVLTCLYVYMLRFYMLRCLYVSKLMCLHVRIANCLNV